MFKFRKRKLTGVLVLAVAAVAAVGAYAFTASNTLVDHYAGVGSAVVTGYHVTSPTDYTFSGDGTKIQSVSFKLDHAASDVKVALTNSAPGQSDWVDCTGSTGGSNDVTCPFTTPIVAGATTQQLTVAAVETGTVTIGS